MLYLELNLKTYNRLSGRLYTFSLIVYSGWLYVFSLIVYSGRLYVFSLIVYSGRFYVFSLTVYSGRLYVFSLTVYSGWLYGFSINYEIVHGLMMDWIEAETSSHCKLLIVLLYDGVFNKCLLFVSLFSWRYNPSGCIFHSPVAGFSLLVF
jgi:hypothetical protein